MNLKILSDNEYNNVFNEEEKNNEEESEKIEELEDENINSNLEVTLNMDKIPTKENVKKHYLHAGSQYNNYLIDLIRVIKFH